MNFSSTLMFYSISKWAVVLQFIIITGLQLTSLPSSPSSQQNECDANFHEITNNFLLQLNFQ